MTHTLAFTIDGGRSVTINAAVGAAEFLTLIGSELGGQALAGATYRMSLGDYTGPDTAGWRVPTAVADPTLPTYRVKLQVLIDGTVPTGSHWPWVETTVAGEVILTRASYRLTVPGPSTYTPAGVRYVTLTDLTASLSGVVTGQALTSAMSGVGNQIATAVADKVITTDRRLSDARVPLPHAAAHAAGGSDPLNLSGLGLETPTGAQAKASAAQTAAQAYADGKVAALVNGAPGILDTLGEIATALQSDQSAVGSLTTAIATKATVTDLATANATIAALQAQVNTLNAARGYPRPL